MIRKPSVVFRVTAGLSRCSRTSGLDCKRISSDYGWIFVLRSGVESDTYNYTEVTSATYVEIIGLRSVVQVLGLRSARMFGLRSEASG